MALVLDVVAIVQSVLFRAFCTTPVLLTVRLIHVVQPFLRPRSTDDPRPCLRCMPCRPAVIGLSFNTALFGSNHIPSFHSPISCLSAHLRQTVLETCRLTISQHLACCSPFLAMVQCYDLQNAPSGPKTPNFKKGDMRN